MVDVEDNIVFEVEIIADQVRVRVRVRVRVKPYPNPNPNPNPNQYELGGISVHLYRSYIPLDRSTELVSDTPDNGNPSPSPNPNPNPSPSPYPIPIP